MKQKHNLGHYKLMTADMGQLIPVGCVEVLPGDKFRHQTSALIRVSPLVAPTMHPVQVRIHHFFIPNRLVNDTWEDFITGGPDGNNTDVVPKYTVTGTNEDLLDYLVGDVQVGMEINAMPIYAFNLTYNQYYRDQDLITERAIDDCTIPQVAWEKDRFTTARPWTQKGSDITIPIAGDAPVKGLVYKSSAGTFTQTTDGRDAYDGTVYTPNDINDSQLSGTTDYGGIFADLTAASGVPIDDFRLALAMQRFKEARARYGSRYVEYLSQAFGVRSSDTRMQRAEYLGGGKQLISFSEVLQTAEGTDPVGDMKGHGIANLRSNRYIKFFEEHGHVISFMSVRPKAIYENAIHPNWFRTDKEDYFTPELELIGQQQLLRREIYAQTDAAGGDTVVGYTDRYRDYREHPSSVHTLFRTTLDHFHLARDFGATPPALNKTFIECVPSKRIHADTSGPTLWCLINHMLVARRKVRRNPVPTTL